MENTPELALPDVMVWDEASTTTGRTMLSPEVLARKSLISAILLVAASVGIWVMDLVPEDPE